MDRPSNLAKEAAESVNLGDQGLPTSDPSESIKSESHAPAEPNEALLRISQYMAWVLERLTALKALIDMVRRHVVEEFHGSNMEESDKEKLWLEKLQRILEEVRCPLVSLLQSEAYDWWKLALRSPRIPVVKEFPDVFLKELPGIPLEREVDLISHRNCIRNSPCV